MSEYSKYSLRRQWGVPCHEHNRMSQTLLVLSSTQAVTTEARCGTDVSLPCNADFTANKYFSLTWYKQNKEGIIRKVLHDKSIRLYKFPRNVSLTEQNGLFLRKVRPEDSGEYECAVSANVGGQNGNFFVTLTVPECEPDPTTSLITLAAVQTEDTFVNRTQSHSGHPMPLAWSLLGYGAVALVKITLSVIVIWIFHVCSRRKRRR
ncbi:uncharacterized protein [Eucyclogobius newberryi]|uniref:uncharacterized protein n=1 Tax=Eucyclogobius newberryi TaxID=166745 RepID=UPI003B59C12F